MNMNGVGDACEDGGGPVGPVDSDEDGVLTPLITAYDR